MTTIPPAPVDTAAFLAASAAPRTFRGPGSVACPHDHFPLPPVGLTLAALTDLPVRPVSRFDFDRDFQNPYLWNKLLFDPRLLPTNPFYRFWPDPEKLGNLFDPAPMNPPGALRSCRHDFANGRKGMRECDDNA